MKPLAFSYVRFSSPEQAKGSSLVRQMEKAQQYAAEHGLVLDDKLTFQDLGVSAYDQSNLGPESELSRFLGLVKAGRVPRGSFLLIESLDRLSRATISVALPVLTGLMNEGITVVTLIDGMRYEQTNSASDFVPLIISLSHFFRANEESKTKAARVSAAWRLKRLAAGSQKLTKKCPAWLELKPDRSEYVVLPDRAAILRRIIDLTMSGVGRERIARQLNAEGVKSIAPHKAQHVSNGSKSNPSQSWHSSYVGKLLSNRALVGEFQPHRMEEIGHTRKTRRVPDGLPTSGYFPALLTEEEFARLQITIREAAVHGGGRKGESFSNLFTGLLKCGYCHSSMVYIDKGIDKRGNRDNARSRFLVCSKANRALGCRKIPWAYGEFEASFFGQASGTPFADFVARATDHFREARLLLDQQALVSENLKRNLLQRKRLVDAIAHGDDGLDDITARLRVLTLEGAVYEQQRDEILAAVAKYEHAAQDATVALEALKHVRILLDERTGPEAYAFRASLNRHLRRVVDRIVLLPGGSLTSAEDAEFIRLELLKLGYDESDVSRDAVTNLRTTPDPSQRCFLISNKNESLQVLHPDAEIPDLERYLESRKKRRQASLDNLVATARK